MGTRVGHVLPGIGYLLFGLWQLFNHTKLYCQNPNSYHPPLWFPSPKIRNLELFIIMTAAGTYIALELFINPSRTHLLDPIDHTIPAAHLHNFEHATITLALIVYTAFALFFDRVKVNGTRTLNLILGSLAFAVEFLVYYLHSTDHSGYEWQYHSLLVVIIAVSLITTLMGIGYPRSFSVGFIRSVSVVFRGIWYIILGIMLYTPRFIPKGCSLQNDGGFLKTPCEDHISLHRAKGLVNLEFTWALIVVMAFSVWFYVVMARKYPEVQEFESFAEKEENLDKCLDGENCARQKTWAR